MSTDVLLTIPALGLHDDTDRSSSHRHSSEGWTETGWRFRLSAGRLYLLQEYAGAAGLKVVVLHPEYCDEPVEGSPASPEVIAARIQEHAPGAPRPLFVGRASMRTCTHADPCQEWHWAHPCPDVGGVVDSDLCEVCPHARGLVRLPGEGRPNVVMCGHPDVCGLGEWLDSEAGSRLAEGTMGGDNDGQ